MNSPIFKGLSIFLGIGATNAATSVNFHELTEAEESFVNLLGKLTSGSKDNCLTVWGIGID